MADTVPDVPATLRAWRDDVAHQDLVAEHLAAGRLLRVATRDDTTEYELLAESVDALRMDRALPVMLAPASLPETPLRERPFAASALTPAHDYRRHPGHTGRQRVTSEESLAETMQLGRLYG